MKKTDAWDYFELFASGLFGAVLVPFIKKLSERPCPECAKWRWRLRIFKLSVYALSFVAVAVLMVRLIWRVC